MFAPTQYQLTAADLDVLLALVRAGNLADAGKRLGADTSTVFRSVQRIEKQLGQTLFTRSRKGYFASDLVLQVVAHAEKIETELEAARAVSLGTQNEVSGLVRLTTLDSVLYNVLMPHLPALAAEHPRLQLELLASHQVASLTKRDADIAIRATHRPPEHLVGHHLGRAHFAIYGSSALFKEKRAPKPLDEYDWISLEDAMPEDPVGKWRRRNFPKVAPRYRVDSLVAVGEAVRAGLGIGAMSTYKARHDPRLRALTPELENCSADLWVLTHQDSRHLRRIAAVYSFIVKTIRLD
ncbi:MAG: LysR family transcriptional regulator [Vicinamibacterales bacterium]